MRIHTDKNKEGPYITVRLKKSDILAAQKKEFIYDLCQGPVEEYSGGHVDSFPLKTRYETLYPAILSIFLGNRIFLNQISEKYEYLGLWIVDQF